MVDIIKSDPAVDTVTGFTGGGQRNGGFMFISLKPRAQRDGGLDQFPVGGPDDEGHDIELPGPRMAAGLVIDVISDAVVADHAAHACLKLSYRNRLAKKVVCACIERRADSIRVRAAGDHNHRQLRNLAQIFNNR